MSGEPAFSVLPRPPKLVSPDDQAPRDPGAWGYYTEAGAYRRALRLYRVAFVFAVAVDSLAPLALIAFGVAEALKRW